MAVLGRGAISYERGTPVPAPSCRKGTLEEDATRLKTYNTKVFEPFDGCNLFVVVIDFVKAYSLEVSYVQISLPSTLTYGITPISEFSCRSIP